MPAKKPDVHTERLGATIKELRKKRGWTQADLADKLGSELGRVVDPSLVTRMERGQRATSVRDVAALAKILGVDIDLLASEDADPLAWDGFEEWRARSALEAAHAALEEAARAYGIAAIDLCGLVPTARPASAATIAKRAAEAGAKEAQG